MIKKLLIMLTMLLVLASCGSSQTKSDPNIDLNAKNGKKTFVGFVATWCPHCQEEVPIFEKFYKDHKNDTNMQLMVVDGKKFT
jgi:thiol-disulfide isomerase/thioredoxin